MIKGYQAEISRIYNDQRSQAEAELLQRRKELLKKLPEISELEKKIGSLSVQLSIGLLSKSTDKQQLLSEMKERITDLKVKKFELLNKAGYPPDYLEIHYTCSKCCDTGFIGRNKCSCYKQKLVSLYYKNSDLKDILKENNFDNFNFELFSNEQIRNEKETPRKNMEKIVHKGQSYIDTFSENNENLLFIGTSGTGKTFLSSCIARELLDKGYLVVYRTSDDLIQNLKTIKFENNASLEDLIVNCDLLIIDDLGTEQISEYSKTELFNFINKKLLKHKKMIISTNLSIQILLKNYSERISSRLFGDFTLCKFYGEDIRIRKNFK
jgi:DNA replication protein DnaC